VPSSAPLVGAIHPCRALGRQLLVPICETRPPRRSASRLAIAAAAGDEAFISRRIEWAYTRKALRGRSRNRTTPWPLSDTRRAAYLLGNDNNRLGIYDTLVNGWRGGGFHERLHLCKERRFMLTEIDRRFTSRCSPSHHEEADVSPSGGVPFRLHQIAASVRRTRLHSRCSSQAAANFQGLRPCAGRSIRGFPTVASKPGCRWLSATAIGQARNWARA